MSLTSISRNCVNAATVASHPCSTLTRSIYTASHSGYSLNTLPSQDTNPTFSLPSAINTSPTLTATQSIPSHTSTFSHLSQSQKNKPTILQWNIRQLSTSHPTLLDTFQKYQVYIALLQEPYVKYTNLWAPQSIPRYHHYFDKYCKTSIYISEHIRHYPIPLQYQNHTCPRPQSNLD